METSENSIAIIGMSGRFPKARTLEQFWQKIRNGEELITFFTDQELLDDGIDPALLTNPHYVKACGMLQDHDMFDATFFGYSPREAEIIDPQQRFFLLCGWEALESAGYVSDAYTGRIGVFAGSGINTYFYNNLLANREYLATVNQFQVFTSNDKDYLPTRLAYKLDLRGPAFGIQTACSTSLVAIHVACQNLLYGECDIAVAGAVTITFPQTRGYSYNEGEISSPDGHCRTFDSNSRGTVRSSGIGVVILKRLEDAMNDRDVIHAVIRGSAINNDGARKVGFTAPSVDGQAEAISEALTIADVAAETISYIEAHGTATPLGDPIEVAALKQAFQASTDKKGFCRIGSLKSNLGHMDTAAGMGGLIKTALALKHGEIPPSLHFEQPNPQLDLANSPFVVNTKLTQWERGETPRRAGVSSFGIGGTNAHVILEEAPAPLPSGESRPWQLLLLSAKTRTALETVTDNLVSYLKEHPDVPLADVAYTLQVGRRHFQHRRMLVCRDSEEAIRALEKRDHERVRTQFQEQTKRPVTFLFSGQGSQYIQMAQDVYATEPVFREQVDICSRLLQPHLGLDLRSVIFSTQQTDEAARSLNQTYLTQPALFTIEYALSKLWMAWGLQPQAMIGHSIGEYVAACLAGVFSLEDALFLVSMRGRLMQETSKGAMLSVALSARDLSPYLMHSDLALAAVNAPALCVVSGSLHDIEQMQQRLQEEGIQTRRLHTTHAFHSAQMDPILEAFRQQIRKVAFHPPTLPYISNVTGNWITPAEATDPHYWTRHLRQTVLFADGIQTLEAGTAFLEVGPGRTLSTLTLQCLNTSPELAAFSSIRHPDDQQNDSAFLLNTLGKLWLAGVRIDWSAVAEHERRNRLALPTYPFELQRYWVAPRTAQYLASTLQKEANGMQPGQDTQQPVSLSDYARPNLSNEYVAPETAIEQRLAEIWQASLGIATIGIYDNFFELGGHSLIATQMVAQLQSNFPLDLSLRSIFDYPTIARLSEVIETKLIEKLEAMPDEV
jgi:phthiocerol/phenolphthiocerol synthesis type-I polyketide synthase E